VVARRHSSLEVGDRRIIPSGEGPPPRAVRIPCEGAEDTSIDFQLQYLGVVLPLVLVIAAGGVRERYRPEARLFAEQPWTYRDVIVVFAVLTSTAFLAPSVTRLAFPPAASPGIEFLFQAVITTGTIFWLLRYKYRIPLSRLGFDTHVLYHTAWPLMVVFAIGSLVGLVSGLVVVVGSPASDLLAWPGLPRPGTHLYDIGRAPSWFVPFVVVHYVAVWVLMPVMEEVVLRSFSFAPLSRRLGQGMAGVFTAGLWVLMHKLELPRVVIIMILGLIYAYLYQRTQSILPSLIFHVSGNTLISIAWLVSELERADRLILPATIVSLILFGIFAGLYRSARPSNSNVSIDDSMATRPRRLPDSR
jgi:membrane protease YdiL (CAAX protease family)